jgi:hypothetical protein
MLIFMNDSPFVARKLAEASAKNSLVTQPMTKDE